MSSPLTTPRLILRRLEPSDAAAVYAYRSLAEVSRYQSWEPATPAEVVALVETMPADEPLSPGEWFQLALSLRTTGELVGDCGLHPREDDRRQVEIGITVAPRFQRQGYAAEAFRAVREYLFTATETHRIFCSVDPRNHPCRQLLAKLGLRQEAHHLESLWINGQWMDDVILAMLKREWEAAHRRDTP